MARAGRNELCPCGSGLKFKRCCEPKQAATGRGTRAVLIAGLIVAAILLIFALMDRDRGPGPGRVWSAEHGHYHAP